MYTAVKPVEECLTCKPKQVPFIERLVWLENMVARSTAYHYLLGLILSLTLMPCSAGPYIVFIMALTPIGIASAIPYLLLYNTLFTTPYQQ